MPGAFFGYLVYQAGTTEPSDKSATVAGRGVQSTGMAITFAVIAVTALVLIAHGFSMWAGLV